MNEPLFLFVGKSSSGKTTVASKLEERYGLKQVFSYCTRPPRYEGEIGHIFVSNEEFNDLGELAAYTNYAGWRYGTTFEQLDKCEIYVIDVNGVKTLLERCWHYNRQIRVIYFNASTYTRIQRMLNRGDSDAQIISRLLQDEKEDWYDQLNALVWHYAHNEHRDIELHSVDANQHVSDVVSQVVSYMKKHKEEMV